MHQILAFVLRHGHAVLFSVVLAEQVGLPIPSVPILLAAGALIGLGHFSLAAALFWIWLASLIGDTLWYYLGRLRGRSILRLLCRISLEPDSCVRRTEDIIVRHDAGAVLFSKFVPGLSTVAPPMAGMVRMAVWKFLAADTAGTLLWGGAYLLAGYIFRTELERVAAAAWNMGHWLGLLVAGLLGAYLGWKYFQRRKVLRSLAIARITPDELREKLAAGESLTIVDLRRLGADLSAEFRLPGAIHMLPSEVEVRHREIPRDQEVVLYCSCPNEVSSARVALMLRQRGILNVRPLIGGFEAWQKLGYPLEPMLIPDAEPEILPQPDPAQ
jgi:membrane protein DedA with SNARE-associated domain/rhodanese-related sulfurtransferase